MEASHETLFHGKAQRTDGVVQDAAELLAKRGNDVHRGTRAGPGRSPSVKYPDPRADRGNGAY